MEAPKTVQPVIKRVTNEIKSKEFQLWYWYGISCFSGKIYIFLFLAIPLAVEWEQNRHFQNFLSRVH